MLEICNEHISEFKLKCCTSLSRALRAHLHYTDIENYYILFDTNLQPPTLFHNVMSLHVDPIKCIQYSTHSSCLIIFETVNMVRETDDSPGTCRPNETASLAVTLSEVISIQLCHWVCFCLCRHTVYILFMPYSQPSLLFIDLGSCS